MADTRSTEALPVWFVEPTFAGRFLAALAGGRLVHRGLHDHAVGTVVTAGGR